MGGKMIKIQIGQKVQDNTEEVISTKQQTKQNYKKNKRLSYTKTNTEAAKIQQRKRRTAASQPTTDTNATNNSKSSSSHKTINCTPLPFIQETRGLRNSPYEPLP
jgi:hypothetical protein